jgi:hypothetical protein
MHDDSRFDVREASAQLGLGPDFVHSAILTDDAGTDRRHFEVGLHLDPFRRQFGPLIGLSAEKERALWPPSM